MNFAQIEAHAQSTDWELIAAIQTHPGGNGYVPHGVALVKRPGPFPGREYATVNWYVQPSGPGFESGHYDLTLESALEDFRERSEGRMTA